MTGKTVNCMLGKTRHLYNGNVRIFPRVMPVGCFHLLFLTVNVLANGNGDPCPHVHNGNYEQRISLLLSKNHSHPDASSVSPKGQTHKGVSTSQSVSQVKSLKSHGRSQAVDVYSFGHSVDSVNSIQSKSDLINRYVYSDTRAFIYQIGSQNPSKIKAILILSDVTSVCDYLKLLEIYIFYNSVTPSVIPQQLPLLS